MPSSSPDAKLQKMVTRERSALVSIDTTIKPTVRGAREEWDFGKSCLQKAVRKHHAQGTVSRFNIAAAVQACGVCLIYTQRMPEPCFGWSVCTSCTWGETDGTWVLRRLY